MRSIVRRARLTPFMKGTKEGCSYCRWRAGLAGDPIASVSSNDAEIVTCARTLGYEAATIQWLLDLFRVILAGICPSAQPDWGVHITGVCDSWQELQGLQEYGWPK